MFIHCIYCYEHSFISRTIFTTFFHKVKKLSFPLCQSFPICFIIAIYILVYHLHFFDVGYIIKRVCVCQTNKAVVSVFVCLHLFWSLSHHFNLVNEFKLNLASLLYSCLFNIYTNAYEFSIMM